MEITNGSNKNKFLNNQLRSVITTANGNAQAIIYSPLDFINQHNVFRNNRFTNGSYGIFYDGHANGNNYIAGTVIENNFFDNQRYRGIYLYRHNKPIIIGNITQSLLSNTNYYDGIWLVAGINGGQISGNKVLIATQPGKLMTF